MTYHDDREAVEAVTLKYGDKVGPTVAKEVWDNLLRCIKALRHAVPDAAFAPPVGENRTLSEEETLQLVGAFWATAQALAVSGAGGEAGEVLEEAGRIAWYKTLTVSTRLRYPKEGTN